MQSTDIPKFTVILASIGELYGKAVSSHLIDIYWQSLKRFELQDVQRAFETHIHNPDGGQFFPKPADVVRFIEGSGETKALLAWAKVEKAIVRVGGYPSIAFDDALIHAVIEDMGGWVKLCAIPGKQLPFSAQEFQKRYMGFVLKKPARHPSYLCGISEGENGKNGFAVQAPVLVGDLEKAQAVVGSGGGTPLVLQHPIHSLSKQVLQISRGNPGEKAKKNEEMTE